MAGTRYRLVEELRMLEERRILNPTALLLLTPMEAFVYGFVLPVVLFLFGLLLKFRKLEEENRRLRYKEGKLETKNQFLLNRIEVLEELNLFLSRSLVRSPPSQPEAPKTRIIRPGEPGDPLS